MKRLVFAILAAGCVVTCGCGGGGEPRDADTTMADTMEVTGARAMDQAVAQLAPTEGNSASGTVTFTPENGATRIEGQITGLTAGQHGIHVHENGDCSAPDAGSAGEHFNPLGAPHGAPDSDQRHVGDLGNIEAGADGTARISMTDSLVTLVGPNAAVGKALIVHADADDLTTQPSGNAGARVACGVIQMEGAPADSL